LFKEEEKGGNDREASMSPSVVIFRSSETPAVRKLYHYYTLLFIFNLSVGLFIYHYYTLSFSFFFGTVDEQRMDS
jgi:hypothetical protein